MRSQHSGGGEAAAQIGYYRWPTISGDEIFFVCEDDVYAAKIAASSDAPSKPRRVTQAQGACIRPAVSPDGSRVAFSCVEDGYVEIYVVDACGGAMK